MRKHLVGPSEGSSDGHVQKGDVLLSIDGHPIESDGMKLDEDGNYRDPLYGLHGRPREAGAGCGGSEGEAGRNWESLWDSGT